MIFVLVALLISVIYFFRDKAKFFKLLFIFSLLLNSVFTIEIFGANFTYPRISFIIFATLQFLIKGFTNSHRFKQYFTLFYLIIIISVISQIQSQIANISDWLYIVDDFFSTIGLFYLFVSNYHLFINKNLSDRIILSLNKFVLFCFSISYIEVFFGTNIYKLLKLDGFTNAVYFGSYFTNGISRIASIFNGTLEFSFFIGFALIISLYCLKSNRKIDVNISKLNLFLAPLIFINTYSRSIIIIGLLIFSSHFLINRFYNQKNKLKIIGFIFPLVLVLSSFNFNEIFHKTTNLIEERSLGTYDEDDSLRERKRQLEFFYDSIDNHGLFLGQGRINTLRFISISDNIYSLDSFWLKLFFESGIISVLIFVFIILRPLIFSFNQILNKSNYNRRMLTFNTIFLIALFFMCTFSLNQDFRIFLIFIVFNCILYKDRNLSLKK